MFPTFLDVCLMMSIEHQTRSGTRLYINTIRVGNFNPTGDELSFITTSFGDSHCDALGATWFFYWELLPHGPERDIQRALTWREITGEVLYDFTHDLERLRADEAVDRIDDWFGRHLADAHIQERCVE